MRPSRAAGRVVLAMIIKPPRWYRALYGGSFIACLVVGLLAAFAVRGTTGVVFGGMFLLLAASFLVMAVMSLTRRFELRGNRLFFIQVTGARQVAVSDIGWMRISRRGDGMSRVEFVRPDGSPMFGGTRGTWPTTVLLQLAEAMKISVRSA